MSSLRFTTFAIVNVVKRRLDTIDFGIFLGMCGIVGAVAERDVVPILLEGLRRLEYRGYDSAGLAVVSESGAALDLVRKEGKVRDLIAFIKNHPISGKIGIAHTRWATHGSPCEANAHPQVSSGRVAVVHNGIIENHEVLRAELIGLGYEFTSETDTEVIAHTMHALIQEGNSFKEAAIIMNSRLEGTFAIVVIDQAQPDYMFAIRRGSPLVIGIGEGENYVASDPLALLPETHRFIYLEEGDIAEVGRKTVTVFNSEGSPVERSINHLEVVRDAVERGNYRHFMAKEIFEQPTAVKETIARGKFSSRCLDVLKTVKRIQIVACGTSYHAGLIGRFWIEKLARIPCQVEIASEHRYRPVVVEGNTLSITISQSGETADTLAALKRAKTLPYIASMTICNVKESSLVRESDLSYITHAGVEIGVASTKAFTTQLVALLQLATTLSGKECLLEGLPAEIEKILNLDQPIKELAQAFAGKQHALFLGRGIHYPIAMEGALKLKELSYIHAEAYPAGELKHGPLALVDKEMPVIVVAPNDELLEKLTSNLHEVRARGGELYVFADSSLKFKAAPSVTIQTMPEITSLFAPILYTIPLQLLAYHVAVLKGTDVDQPRNLAKSVTVE